MSDDSQIEVPQSFLALFVVAGRARMSLSRAELAQRYELCEDLANMLVPTAQEMFHGLGITESDVLQRSYQGLCTEPAVVSAAEAGWVIFRLAELSGWPLPVSPLAA